VLPSFAMLRTSRSRRIALSLVLLGLGTPAFAAVRIDPLHNDSGTYRVYFRDRLLGTEKFSLEPRGDRVAVISNVDEQIPTPDGDKKLQKKASLTIKTLDYDIVGYQSEQNFLGTKLSRGVSPGDTVLTTYREGGGVMGGGDTYLRPPGKMFVIDSQVFALFDVLLRSLHGRMFERTMPVIVLAEPRDTILDISCRPGDVEKVTVQGKAYSAQRVSLSDGASEFTAWIAPSGQMLRLEQPAAGLRVERLTLYSTRVPNPADTTAKAPGVSTAKPATRRVTTAKKVATKVTTPSSKAPAPGH